MYYRIIRNDMLKSKLITLTTMMFVAVAAMLVSLSAILVVNLSGSINMLMDQAKTPHFMQMHSGDIDAGRLADFAEQNSHVDEFQVLEFLNVDGARIVIDGNSLADSVQDNGFTTQSEKFDYLLDLDGNVITVSDGEIYIPVSYMKDGTGKVGDTISINGKTLTVAGFLRDSQMNSLLASSKRFLVSENDYAAIKGSGSMEYLIEFRLKDLSEIGAFETDYTSAELEANGPTITYPLFKMLNAISDGLMIAVLLLVSTLIVAITFMCIHFTLLAKIEDDYREIGVMKAIGLRVSDLKKIYLVKYAVIAAAGCMLGFALSFVFRDLLLENIRLYMGESEHASFAFLFGIVGILVVFLAIVAYVNNVLKRFRKISAAQAIRLGTSQGKAAGAKHFRLSRNRLLNTNIFLGVKDVLARKSLYATMLAVLIISTFIIIVPQNLYNTISSKSFITYMGIGSSDMRMDIQQTSHISEKAAEIVKAMERDSSISKYAVLTTKTFKAKAADGSEQGIKIELGDHSILPVQYSEGKAPVAEDEIALSTMNADDLGIKVGDVMTLVIEGKEKDFTVCGVYSDVTNGGKTAKAVFSDESADIMWCVIYAKLSDPSLAEAKTSEYADRFHFAKVSHIDEYVAQTFGSTISSVGKASDTSVAVALMITGLVILLFMKMLVAKDSYSIAVMKSVGFTDSDIAMQYVSRSVFVLMAGMILGTLLANTIGEVLAGAVISSFGAASFQFADHPLSMYPLLLMAGTVLIATMLGTWGAGQIKLAANMKE
ncbi:ABC transporter permease [Domibacillus indicus]|uniref:ABC transporter permease n=1 Tax=Domibacillus indicus TaxID=1437523 RepID=UPI0006181558|nr:FtsX-like permease family protein [Domibacillus indicus]